jgi:hypothetical protein
MMKKDLNFLAPEFLEFLELSIEDIEDILQA